MTRAELLQRLNNARIDCRVLRERIVDPGMNPATAWDYLTEIDDDLRKLAEAIGTAALVGELYT